jgi:hypothetical protein
LSFSHPFAITDPRITRELKATPVRQRIEMSSDDEFVRSAAGRLSIDPTTTTAAPFSESISDSQGQEGLSTVVISLLGIAAALIVLGAIVGIMLLLVTHRGGERDDSIGDMAYEADAVEIEMHSDTDSQTGDFGIGTHFGDTAMEWLSHELFSDEDFDTFETVAQEAFSA